MKNLAFALMAALGVTACDTATPPATDAENAGPTVLVPVAGETTPSTSDSAAAPLLWSGETGQSRIVGAVEDGIELYGADGKRISKIGLRGVEAISVLSGFGADQLLALDTASSRLLGVGKSGDRLELLNDNIVTSTLLLEGMCSMTSPLDGKVYAFLLASNGQIEQWNLYIDKAGQLQGRLIRNLQVGSEPKFCVTDPVANTLYVTEEAVGVWKFNADVEAETVPELIDVKKFGHFTGEVGGLALHRTDDGRAVLFASDVEASLINAYDVLDDHRFIGQVRFTASDRADGVDNAGALFATSGADATIILADEDNGEDATNFKFVSLNTVAAQLSFPTVLKAPEGEATPEFALVSPRVETEPVESGGDAADDPAIWVHPTDGSKSLIIGTNKQGGLYVYNLDGSVRQYLPDGKINNVDIRYGVALGDDLITLVAASNRTHDSISLYQMDEETGLLRGIADGIQPTNMADPYGMCLFQSPVNGATYVFVNEKNGLVRQWMVNEGSAGKLKTTQVREFEVGSTSEGCVVDDDTGTLFVAEEDVALWKYGAEPDAGADRTKVTDPVMTPALKDDLEGVSIYYGAGESGYIVLSSQGNNSYALFDRQAPHAYRGSFRVIATDDGLIDGSSETDGLDIISTPLGPDFPFGVFVAQDGRNIAPTERQNFKLVPWDQIAESLGLERYTERDPRT